MPKFASSTEPSTAANPIESNPIEFNPIQSDLKIKWLAQSTEVVEKHIDKVASKEIEDLAEKASKEIETARELSIALIEPHNLAAELAIIKGDVEAMKKRIGTLETEAAKMKAKVTNMDELLGE